MKRASKWEALFLCVQEIGDAAMDRIAYQLIIPDSDGTFTIKIGLSLLKHCYQLFIGICVCSIACFQICQATDIILFSK